MSRPSLLAFLMMLLAIFTADSDLPFNQGAYNQQEGPLGPASAGRCFLKKMLHLGVNSLTSLVPRLSLLGQSSWGASAWSGWILNPVHHVARLEPCLWTRLRVTIKGVNWQPSKGLNIYRQPRFRETFNRQMTNWQSSIKREIYSGKKKKLGPTK